jgi:hypothetical protein
MVGDQGLIRQPNPDHVGAIDSHPCPGMFGPDIDIGSAAMDLPDGAGDAIPSCARVRPGKKRRWKEQKT